MSVILLLLAIAITVSASPWEAQQTSFVRRRTEEDYYYNDEADASSPASIKYGQCFRNNYGNEMVYFIVCPASSGCVAGCSGGQEYVSDLGFFVQAFVQAQVSARCAQAEANCGNDDECFETYGCFQETEEEVEEENEDADAAGDDGAAGDDVAEDDAAAGDDAAAVDDAVAADDGVSYNDAASASLRLQDYLDCVPYGSFYIGAYCQDHMIYLGAYVDNQCTWLADDGAFSSIYGRALEYSQESGTSLVEDTCATCSASNSYYDDGIQGVYGQTQCPELIAAGMNGLDDPDEYSDVDRMKSNNWSKVALMVGLTALATISMMAFCWFRFSPMDDKKTALLSAFAMEEPASSKPDDETNNDTHEYQEPSLPTPAPVEAEKGDDVEEAEKEVVEPQTDEVSTRSFVAPSIVREQQARSVASSTAPPSTVAARRDSPPMDEEPPNTGEDSPVPVATVLVQTEPKPETVEAAAEPGETETETANEADGEADVVAEVETTEIETETTS